MTLLHTCSSIGLAGVVFSMVVAIGVVSAHAGQVQPIEISRGTLVAVVPYSTGAMVAADSRETISGLYCDQRLKIRTPDGIENLVVAVTGSSRFYDLTALVGKGRVVTQPDLCSFVTAAPHLFDMESVVLDWLRGDGPKSAKDVSLDRLAAHCVERFAIFIAAYPQLAPPPAPNGLMNVILVSYDPKSRETLVRDFRINRSAAGAVFSSDSAVYQYSPSTPSAFRLFGEADKFAQFVWPTFRSQRLRADTRSLLSKQVLTQDVTSLQAEALAVDMIEQGADNPNLNTSEEGVGRPVRLVRIDTTGRPEMLR
jgi:hypothetical protein